MAAAIIAIAVLVGGLYVIAKAEGVNVSDQLSQLGQDVTSEAESVVNTVTGGGDDPISLALPILKQFEGFSANAYPDPPGSGKYSIGYGHQIQPGESYGPNSQISESEGEGLLRIDAGAAFTCVSNNVTVNLTPQQTAALISFCFNIGCGAFEQSTLLNLLNQGDYDGAAAQFPVWIHSGGQVSDALVSRRAQEQELFTA